MAKSQPTDKKIIMAAARNMGLLVAYVFLVGSVMVNAETLLAPMERYPWLGLAGFLMLFVLSAFVCGLLALAQPAGLFVRGQHSEALRLLVYTGLWLFGWTVVLFALINLLG